LSNLEKKCAFFGLLGVNSRNSTYMFIADPLCDKSSPPHEETNGDLFKDSG